jgi:hypothetical protein
MQTKLTYRVCDIDPLAHQAVAILAATLYATFSRVIACMVKTRECFMGVG